LGRVVVNAADEGLDLSWRRSDGISGLQEGERSCCSVAH
jgi:hypothetical protein